MRLTELLNTENVTISCELFPPKQGAQLLMVQLAELLIIR